MSKKPEGIPEGIWAEAKAVFDWTEAEMLPENSVTYIARAILAAVEAEREACVKSLDELLTTYVPNDPERYGVEASVAAIRQRRKA